LVDGIKLGFWLVTQILKNTNTDVTKLCNESII
jgi:hypothetical protein